MSNYIIGDVQGCFDELMALLELIDYSPQQDCLWFCGDLVNRGPKSLEVLRFISKLKHTRCVLGNHDLHLLAVWQGAATPSRQDTLDAILSAPDCNNLLNWLRHQPLFIFDKTLKVMMVHAGLAPCWDIETATALNQEVIQQLQGKAWPTLLQYLYGNQPDTWSESLQGWDRYRCIINTFTRLRFCTISGTMALDLSGPPGSQGDTLVPWYTAYKAKPLNTKIFFGHWAALNGLLQGPQLFSVDTGCVWGGHLTAVRVEDQRHFKVKSHQMTK
jgi:bis(5'-nucleosyl)-tetraphosphatase (symmetrical)